MSGPERRSLYSPELLALAVELADYPLDPGLRHLGEARSKTCGSTLVFGCNRDSAGAVGEFGMRVTACAVGQAAAAIFARHVAGRTEDELAASSAALSDWLGGEGDMPDWPGIDRLAPALPHRGRHGAFLLPWRAALDALSKGRDAR